jgi:uncharacterized surface anchored protein
VRITQREINSSSQTSSITGQVTDPNGAFVPGATVTLQNTSRKQVQTTTTDEGAFEFSELAPGKYSIKVTLQGFGKHKPVEIRLDKNQSLTVELPLVLPAGEVLVGVVAYDETDPPGTTTISQKLLRSLPH